MNKETHLKIEKGCFYINPNLLPDRIIYVNKIGADGSVSSYDLIFDGSNMRTDRGNLISVIDNIYNKYSPLWESLNTVEYCHADQMLLDEIKKIDNDIAAIRYCDDLSRFIDRLWEDKYTRELDELTFKISLPFDTFPDEAIAKLKQQCNSIKYLGDNSYEIVVKSRYTEDKIFIIRHI